MVLIFPKKGDSRFLILRDKQFTCTSLILNGKNRKKWSLVPRERLVLVLIFFQILTSGPYSVVLINHNECIGKPGSTFKLCQVHIYKNELVYIKTQYVTFLQQPKRRSRRAHPVLCIFCLGALSHS